MAKYLCIKDLVMEYDCDIDATKGHVYEVSFEEGKKSLWFFMDNRGCKHYMSKNEMKKYFTETRKK
jgi:hypothetical protein